MFDVKVARGVKQIAQTACAKASTSVPSSSFNTLTIVRNRDKKYAADAKEHRVDDPTSVRRQESKCQMQAGTCKYRLRGSPSDRAVGVDRPVQ